MKFANKCRTKIWILKQLLHGKSACGHLRIVSSRFKRTVNKTGKHDFQHLCCAGLSWQTFSLFQGSRCTGHGLFQEAQQKPRPRQPPVRERNPPSIVRGYTLGTEGPMAINCNSHIITIICIFIYSTVYIISYHIISYHMISYHIISYQYH